jgi:hypothetical protein
MVVVAPGDPGTPLVCWASAGLAIINNWCPKWVDLMSPTLLTGVLSRNLRYRSSVVLMMPGYWPASIYFFNR